MASKHLGRLTMRFVKRVSVLGLCVGITWIAVTRYLFPQKHTREDEFGNFQMIFPASLKKSERPRSMLRGGNGATSKGCVIPRLDPFDKTILPYLGTPKDVSCEGVERDWVYTHNGTFYIAPEAQHKHGKITCAYTPLIRSSDFKVGHGAVIEPMLNGSALTSDFFKVTCKSSDNAEYSNIHMGIHRDPKVFQRLEEKKRETVHASASENANGHGQGQSLTSTGSQGLGLNVFMFGHDSTSRMSWIRNLPQTREYFLQMLGGVELEGYNIVGDGTPAALLPILTGKVEEELPETRRGQPGAQQVDVFPWVWKDFSRHGYVTAHGEDMQSVGTFQYRLLGFKDQPTDHHMRTFYLEAEPTYRRHKPFCLGSVTRHLTFMNWYKDLFTVYKDHPKWFFGFHSEYSHGYSSMLRNLDSDLKSMLEGLEKEGHLNNTLLILMADHGARFQELRATKQGSLEERMPYFALRLPVWFREKHPDIVRNLHINSQRLTTPFDIHATFMDILHYSGPGVADISQRGVSLFKEIPATRTCSDAGIAPHWCACLDWKPLDQSDPLLQRAAESAVAAINSYTEGQRGSCAELSLQEVKEGAVYVPTERERKAEQLMRTYIKNDNMLKELLLEYSLTKNASTELYKVTLVTQPGGGMFEVTCTHDLTADTFSISKRAISRINVYGSAPACIAKKLPHLRPYCYCR